MINRTGLALLALGALLFAAVFYVATTYNVLGWTADSGTGEGEGLTPPMLVALYTGTRASAICGAALQPTAGCGWIDVARGVFYRRPEGERETKKRKPPVPLPPELHGHLRRWQRRGQRFAVEWLGQPVQSIDKAFRAAVEDAGLSSDVTPHVLRHSAATWLSNKTTGGP